MNPIARIHEFNISVTGYYEQGKDNLFPDLYGCANPGCSFSGRLSKNGFYDRNAIWLTGIYRIVIQRYRCPVCGKSDSVLPSFLLPRFQYSLLLIFYCLKVLAITKATLIEAATSTSETLSYQLVIVYRSRFAANAKLCMQVLACWGYQGPVESGSEALFSWVQEVEKQGGIELFSMRFYDAWHRTFLSPPG